MENKKVLLAKLEAILTLHEKMSKSYFFAPPGAAIQRRLYEENNSQETEFEFNGNRIKVIQETRCSCKHVYYSVKYFVNDERVSKDIRFVKKLIKEIQTAEEKRVA